jgi:hypothetical protein
VAGEHGGATKIKLRAGSRRKSKCGGAKFLAEKLKIPERAIMLERGHKSREKMIRVEGLSEEDVRRCLLAQTEKICVIRGWLLSAGSVVFELGKNQAASGGLKRTGDDDHSSAANMSASVVHHNHRSVRQITNGLMCFAAFLDQVEFQFVTRH